MKIDYKKIRIDHTERFGKDLASGDLDSLDYHINKYPTEVHFIEELIQNADDEGANEMIFRLYKNRLEVSHLNGEDFNFEDIVSI
jgi:hypothetical protein